jgi:hypothetical protein
MILSIVVSTYLVAHDNVTDVRHYIFRKQGKTLGKFFLFSFLWGFFQWFYTAGDGCGFQNFPTLGLQAYNKSELWALFG